MEMYKKDKHTNEKCMADVAGWLRRLTRTQIPFGSAGSNPAVCELFFNLE